MQRVGVALWKVCCLHRQHILLQALHFKTIPPLQGLNHRTSSAGKWTSFLLLLNLGALPQTPHTFLVASPLVHFLWCSASSPPGGGSVNTKKYAKKVKAASASLEKATLGG